jgi:hypothetical protein
LIDYFLGTISMSNDANSIPPELSPELDQLADSIRQLAHKAQGDSVILLALLRTLESLHREVREGEFQESLPGNRQALHNLLRDIEAKGGWPYISRMRLQDLMFNLLPEHEEADTLE